MTGTEERDADLTAQIAAGHRDALETVYREYGGSVKGTAMRVLRNDHLAEEVVQEVILDLWKTPTRFDPKRGSLRTFLLTLAHRRAVDVVRSEVARSKREERPPDPVVIDVEEEVWSKDVSETVRAALADLGEGEREAITLAYFGGLPYREVAKRLGEPEGTVKSRIRSGMKKLSVTLAGVPF